MLDRTDPARTGVKAGRVVGSVTAAVAIAALVRPEASFYRGTTTALRLVGVESADLVTVVVAGNAVIAGVARYTVGYVVGSLVGVVYDWLDHSTVALVGTVAVVGLADAVLAVLDTRSPLVGAGYFFAWLAYVPVFYWFAPDSWTDDDGPLRLG
ncbi:MAG: hypothetical protein ABEI75_03575 [Halobaculum sp.]